MLVDNSMSGFAHDAPNTVYITAEARAEQAAYFRDIFRTRYHDEDIPQYVFRDMYYFFFEENYGDKRKFPDTHSVIDAYLNHDLRNSTEYKQIATMIRYCDSNKEAQQVLGMIQLVRGSLSAMVKEQKYARIMLDYPETLLHPKRERKIMAWIYAVCKEYDFPIEKD